MAHEKSVSISVPDPIPQIVADDGADSSGPNHLTDVQCGISRSIYDARTKSSRQGAGCPCFPAPRSPPLCRVPDYAAPERSQPACACTSAPQLGIIQQSKHNGICPP